MFLKLRLFIFVVLFCGASKCFAQGPIEALGDPIFVISREDVGKEVVASLFKPLRDTFRRTAIRITDIEEATIVVSVVDGKKVASNRLARIRYVEGGNGDVHFCRVYESDSPKVALDKVRIVSPRPKSRINRSKQAEEIKSLLRSERGNPRLTSGAMILTEQKCFAKKLRDEHGKEMSRKVAKRVSDLAPLMHIPILTSADVLYGYSDPGKIFESYDAMPVDRIEVFENGSHCVAWAPLNGKVERKILFSSDEGMLPVLLEDRLISSAPDGTDGKFPGHSPRLIAKTITSWSEDKAGKWGLDRAYASYSGRHAASTHIVSNFSYTHVPASAERDYFSSESLGFVLPAVKESTSETRLNLQVKDNG